jgi:phenylacetate-CoA ligase
MGLLATLSFSAQVLWLKRVPHLPPEKVQALQRKRLRRLVRRAVERCPFWRDKYRGINPDRFDLADLPPTNKREIMAHFDRAVTDPRLRLGDIEAFIDDPDRNAGQLYRGRYVVSHSSGSQGQPMVHVQDRRLQDLLFALQLGRGNVSAPATPLGAVRRFFHPARLAVVSMNRGFYPSAVAFEYFPPGARTYVTVLRLAQTDPRMVEKLNQFRPFSLACYAATLDALAVEALEGRLDLRPQLLQITSNSETLTEQARERVERAFGVPVLDNYATCECTFLSQGCPTDRGAHVNADWAILENVDEDYNPVPAGVPGARVLITNLANTVQPIIRYELNDIITMAAAPCRCGSRLPRVERIEGRKSDVFWVRDGPEYRPLPPRIFKHAFDHVRELREWQAVQVERNRIKLRLEPLPGARLDELHVWRMVNRQLDLCDLRRLVKVDLELVPALRPDPKTGKFHRSQSLVGPPPDPARQELRATGS